MSQTLLAPHAPLATRPQPSSISWVAFAFALVALLLLVLFLPHGEMGPSGHMEFDPVTKRQVFVHEPRPFRTAGSMLGEFAFIALVASVLVAYPLPWLRSWSHAKRAIIHAVLGVMILALGIGHAMLLAFDQSSRGWLAGALSLAGLAAHGVFAMLRGPLTRAWGAPWWRFAHHSSAWAAVAFTAEHVLVASWHFGFAGWFHDAGWA